MKDAWKNTALGGAAGAIAALAIMFGLPALGLSPPGATSGTAVRDYLMAHPGVIVDATNKLQADQDAAQDATQQRAVDRLGMKAFLDPRLAFVVGPANAKTTIVEFFDYNCPYCRASLPSVKKFLDTNKNARFAFIEFPIKGRQSTVAARAGLAARLQPAKYLAFHIALMNEQGIVDENTVYADAQKVGMDVGKLKSDMQSSRIDLALAASHTLAAAADIDGTPAFIVNGKIREGALDDETLKQMLNG
jgi:protein-disulfide isomerase